MANYGGIIANATAAYNNTLAGYRNTLQQQQQAQQGVIAGYNQLQGNVLRGLEGASAADKQAIIDQYTAASGKAQLGAIGRGLGNTTVLDSIQRGLGYDQAKAQTMRANEFAKTAAGYQTQLGLAGLGYQGQALNANMNFAGQGLQYGGEAGLKLGGLAANLAELDQRQAMQDAQLKQQQAMQDAQLKQQRDLARLYGVGGGGGGGHVGSYGGDSPKGGGGGGGYQGGGQAAPGRYDPMVANPLYGGTFAAAPSYGGSYGSSGGDFEDTSSGSSYGGVGEDWGGGAAPDDYGGDYGWDGSESDW